MLVDANSPAAVPGGVAGAIRQAARATGTSFHYLLATAKVESNLQPGASARSTSAGGLFQFIDQTWLGTLKQSGEALGYGRYAQAIERTGAGRYVVSDPALRTEIMELRKDPTANAAMAGAFTKANAAYLTRRLGRAPSEGDLYIAHFLGAGGAAKLITLAGATPNAIAADSFSAAARANRDIFFTQDGRPRSFADVTRALTQRYAVARAGGAAQPAAEAAVPTPAPKAQVARAYEAAAVIGAPAIPYLAAAQPADATPPLVQATAPIRSVPRATALSGEPLGLFQDMPPSVRGLFTGS